MNDINASIGISNLEMARASVLSSRNNSKEYIKRVSNDNLVLPEWDDSCSYWLFSMHVKNDKKVTFMQYLTDNGVANSPVHYRNDMYSSTIKFKENQLPGVTEFDKTQICIPNGFWLSESDREKIISLLNKF